MFAYKLEKDMIMYKNQFEEFTLKLFHKHLMERVSMELDGILFRIKYMIKYKKDLDKLPKLKEEFIQKALELRNVFGTIFYNILIDNIGLNNFKLDDIKDVFVQDVKMDNIYIKFNLTLISENEDYLKYVDEKTEYEDVFNLYPNKFFRFFTDSYNDGVAKAFPELFEKSQQDEIGTGSDADVFCHNFTFQTGEGCNLNCTYCYQFNKSKMRMEFETAKTFIDNLLDDKYGYINRYNSPAIIIEFIGGEPFLEIALTRRIYEYFLERCYELNHPWFILHRISICSNGLLYFDPEVQSFFNDYSGNISFNISIDGNKELHDSCRIQPNGEGSYDIDMVALNHFNRHHTPERNSKMTLAPENMTYLYESMINFINNGMRSINLNCIFEEGWDQKTALIEYEQLVKVADYILLNDLEHLYISIFNERQEEMQTKSYDGNFCFKAGTMITTDRGQVPIEEIKLWDKVLTQSGKYFKVAEIQKRIDGDIIPSRWLGDPERIDQVDCLIVVLSDGREIYTTKEHPFFAREMGGSCFWPHYGGISNPPSKMSQWIKAEDLIEKSDFLRYSTAARWYEVLDKDEGWIRVDRVYEPEKKYPVYNLTILNDHTYYADGILVHNCGGLGSMLSLRPNGQFYPCIRYMPTSVGDNVPDLCIGDIQNGMIGREQNSPVLKMMDNITRRSQSNDICFDCPIGSDCAWCSALSHTIYGTPGKRPMFICIQMIAEALANTYYWNLLNIKKPQYHIGVRKNNVPDEWALLVIDQEELDYLKKIEAYSMIITMENGEGN